MLLSPLGVDALMVAAMGGILVFAADDMVVWLIWLLAVRKQPMAAVDPALIRPLCLAIYVPAFDESLVIEPMLRATGQRVDYPDYRIFVGCYPNDRATMAAVGRVVAEDGRIIMVSGDQDGPTSKAECLNRCWQAMVAHEQATGCHFEAIILHDAEDVIHPDELWLYARALGHYDMVQVPVHPLIDSSGTIISAHYADEFAVMHGMVLAVRHYVGAALPSAGVGYAVHRRAMDALASRQADRPFDEASLTEDYELGLKLGAMGFRGCVARAYARCGTGLVRVEAYFPRRFLLAVRQKSRWMTGIVIMGWARLGWAGGMAERWMRYRDRRVIVGAVVEMMAYGVAILSVVSQQPVGLPLYLPLAIGLLLWQGMLRCYWVTLSYGWRQGVLALFRMPVSTVMGLSVALHCGSRHLRRIWWGRRDGQSLHWDKTANQFPSDRLENPTTVARS